MTSHSDARDEFAPEGATTRRGFDRLGDLLFAAAAFQCLRASCETGLLDILAAADDELDRQTLSKSLGIEGRWLDTLLTGACALGLSHRSAAGKYRLAGDVAAAVGDWQWPLFKSAVAFEHYITYPGIHDFTESLNSRTNVGVRHFDGEPGQTLYDRLENRPDLQKVFYDYMNSWSRIGFSVLLSALRSVPARRVLDVGGGDGVNAIELMSRLPGLRATVLDIAATTKIARQRVQAAGLSDRIAVQTSDILTDTFPLEHDVVLFAHQLVIWTETQNLELLSKANAALPVGGHVVIFSSMTADSEDGPLIAALASIYHTCIPVEGGRIYSWQQYEQWLGATGFGDTRRVPPDSWTPHGAIVARKIHHLG